MQVKESLEARMRAASFFATPFTFSLHMNGHVPAAPVSVQSEGRVLTGGVTPLHENDLKNDVLK